MFSMLLTAEELRQIVKDSGLKVQDVAKLVGLPRPTLSRWLRTGVKGTRDSKNRAALARLLTLAPILWAKEAKRRLAWDRASEEAAARYLAWRKEGKL